MCSQNKIYNFIIARPKLLKVINQITDNDFAQKVFCSYRNWRMGGHHSCPNCHPERWQTVEVDAGS
jgi:hypothetical protein